MAKDNKKCPNCGGKLFEAIPKITSTKEILEFQKTASSLKEKKSQIDEGWIHPGTYCYECEYAFTAHYPIPNELYEEDKDKRDGYLILISPGPNKLKVAAEIKKIKSISSSEVMDLINVEKALLAEEEFKQLWKLKEMASMLEKLGAEVKLIRVDKT